MKTKFRHLIQLAATVLFNGFFVGFQKGTIFRGASKMFCLPVLNCYSCPGAVGACPIGSLQAVLGDRNHHFSFYVLGTLMLFGILLGRLICAFLCPFGFVQELLYKIKLPKLRVPRAVDRPLRYLKYVILVLFVIVGPILLTNAFGMGSPYFCKYICPAGTLEGGIPLVASNPALQNTIGGLFFWKLGILIVILLLSVFVYRPFCKYICPLGAVYALFNRFSAYQIQIDRTKCIGCRACERACKMEVRITESKDIGECIRCGECKSACPKGAIQSSFFGGKRCSNSLKKPDKQEPSS